MPRDTYRRIQKYEAKLDPEIIKKRFEVQKQAMVEQEAGIFAELVSIEEAAKTILDAEGVPISIYPMYLCYVREIWRLQKNYGGDVLYDEVRVAEAKWVSRALSATVLERLRVDIFGITLPPAP